MLRQALLEVHSENRFLEVAKSHGVSMKVADCRRFNRKSMTLLLELGGSPARIHSAVIAIRRMPGVRHVEESEHKKSSPASILVMVNIPKICQVSRDLLTLCLECPYNSEGETMFWRFAFQDPGDLRQAMENLNRMGIPTRLKELAPIDERPTITTRQLQVINTAMKRGYYEFPREISLTELSEALGVKPSTLSEILRSAERRILQNATQSLAHLNHVREYVT